MRVLVQRVSRASVSVEGKVVGSIGNGLLLLIGVARDDTELILNWVVEKCVNLRIFEDDAGKMNCSLIDVSGEILAISQFTLMADTRRGRRPGFSEAAPPEVGKIFYESFIDLLKGYGINVSCGIFGAEMDVDLVNRGPVTIMVEKEPQTIEN